ncbi:hypothetical protein [Amycolatopsis samaneae]|uniref:Uncharacterized protein n=1 Tax=Amycolatopsis samaneae TaxID=664691 RepID=A0ABW5GS29_9PSEU
MSHSQQFVPLFIEHLTKGDVSRLQCSREDGYTETIESDPGIPSRALAVVIERKKNSPIRESEVVAFAIMTLERKLRNLHEKVVYRIFDIDWQVQERKITVARFGDLLHGNQYDRLCKGLEDPGSLPVKSSENLIQSLRALNSGIDSKISTVLQEGKYDNIPQTERVQRAEERDALATTFEIAGIDRVLLRNVDISAGTPFLTSASRSLLESNSDERSLLRVEMSHFDGLTSVDGPTANSTVFHHPDIGELTVANIDTSPAETASGVDLIYYRHETESFILVQYKRMHNSGQGWKYTEDHNLRKQLKAMRSLLPDDGNPDEPKPGDPSSPWDFRLAPNPGYFKFVRSVDYLPHSYDLMPGMHIPAELMELLLSHDQYTTASGKLAIGLDTDKKRNRESTFQPPYMSNTEFLTLFRGGWAGSRGTTTERIMEIIEHHARDGRALVVALHRGGPATVRPGWRNPVGRR